MNYILWVRTGIKMHRYMSSNKTGYAANSKKKRKKEDIESSPVITTPVYATPHL